jgi:hypothetical protein
MDVDQAVETTCAEVGHFDPDLLTVFVEGKSQLAEIRGGLS